MVIANGLILAAAFLPVPAVQQAREAWFADQLARLAPDRARAERLAAVKAIGRRAVDPKALDTAAALERCVRQDPDAEVRGQAVASLTLVSMRHHRPFSVAHAEALLDADEDVRWQAITHCGPYQGFAPGCVPVLLRCLGAAPREVRSCAVSLLGAAGAGDESAIQALRAATKDPVFSVSHNAHIALFAATGRKLEDMVPYFLRLHEEEPPPLGPTATEDDKREQGTYTLAQFGTFRLLEEAARDRPDDLARVLISLLESNDPGLRKATARYVAHRKDRLASFAERFGSLELGGAKGDGPTLTARLRERNAAAALRKLRDTDPDELTQGAAIIALDRLADPDH